MHERTFSMVVCAALATACGGKVVFVEGAGGAQPTSSTDATSSGSCDPAARSIDITGLDTSCSGDADCVPAFVGDLCQGCVCPTTAINVSEEAKYQAEAAKKAMGVPPGGCFCPAAKPVCLGGQCAVEMP